MGRDDQLASFGLLLARIEQRRSEQSMIISCCGALFELSPKVRWSDRFKHAAAVLKSFTLTMDAADSWSIGLDTAAAEGYADTANLSLDLTDVFVALSEAAQECTCGVVLLFDEVQFLSRQQFEALIEALHKMVQRRLPITLVAAGLPQIAELAGDAKSYADRLFTFTVIGNLGPDDARDALLGPAAEEGTGYTDGALDAAVRITGGYPNILQELGSAVSTVAEGGAPSSVRIEWRQISAYLSCIVRLSHYAEGTGHPVDAARVLGREYRPRIIDAALQGARATSGAVVVEGARATGKTMTALHAAASYVFIDDAEVQRLIEVAPGSLLEGAAPRLLDEWQVAPLLWNLVRRAVDSAGEPGRFILTGSAVPADDATRHTGAGRFLRLRQRTMSWWEKLEAPTGAVSLSGLFEGERPRTDLRGAPDLDTVIENLLRPGFPAMTALSPVQSAARLRGYVDDVARTDIRRIADVRRRPEVVKQLIAALARSVASEVTYRTLASDLRTVAPTIDEETVSNYVGLLQRLFIVQVQQPWTPALRSRARVRTSSRLHLVDPALAAAALGAGHQRLRDDLRTLGTLFESAVVHDLTVLVSPLDGEVRHYRDSNNKEIDAIITLPDGRWGAVEVKLGGQQLAAGAASLQAAIAQIDTTAVGEPAFRLVVTGTGPVLVTGDGTLTAPLSALAP